MFIEIMLLKNILIVLFDIFDSMNQSLLIRPHGQAVKTSPFHGGNRGSNPLGVINAEVAQLAEQLTCNQQVIGSSPIFGFGFRDL